MIYIEMWVAIATLFITLVGLIWKTASIYGDLKHQVQRNREDVNRMGNSLREEIKRETWPLRASISHLQEHLHEKDNYHAPSYQKKNN